MVLMMLLLMSCTGCYDEEHSNEEPCRHVYSDQGKIENRNGSIRRSEFVDRRDGMIYETYYEVTTGPHADIQDAFGFVSFQITAIFYQTYSDEFDFSTSRTSLTLHYVSNSPDNVEIVVRRANIELPLFCKEETRLVPIHGNSNISFLTVGQEYVLPGSDREMRELEIDITDLARGGLLDGLEAKSDVSPILFTIHVRDGKSLMVDHATLNLDFDGVEHPTCSYNFPGNSDPSNYHPDHPYPLETYSPPNF